MTTPASNGKGRGKPFPDAPSVTREELMELRQQQQALLDQLNKAQATASTSGSVIGSSPELDRPPAVAAVSIKLPDFYPSDPALWFARAECLFSHRGITAQRTKFDYVAAALSEQFSMEVRELLISPPQTEPYTTLKSQLIARTQMSEQKRLRRLLTEEELGDRTPSHLLRRMQQLIGSSQLDESILRELFLQRLPSNAQLVLASTPKATSLSELAAIADRVMETTQASVSAIQRPSQDDARMSALEQQIAALTEAVSSLHKRLDGSRGRSPGRGSGPPRSRNNSPGRPGLCFFHSKFGDQAKNCRPPCSRSSN
eukprot:scpid16937/ scgid27099/ 